jgi:hypothetical protein
MTKLKRRNGVARRQRDVRKDKRYPPGWSDLSRFTLAVTLGQCSWCWWRRAKYAHHMYYPWYFLQWPLLCLLPLCSKCHQPVAHDRSNAVEDRRGRHLFNYPHYVLRAQVKMILLIGIEGALIISILAVITKVLIGG